MVEDTDSVTVPLGDARVRRLSPTEYRHAVVDLFGIPQAALSIVPMQEGEPTGPLELQPWLFPPDVEVSGFDEQSRGQSVSAYIVEQYQQAAAHYAAYVLSADRLFDCDAESRTTDEACGRAAMHALATRAFRHPLSDDERVRLDALFDAQVQALGVSGAITLTTEAILQSPEFLYAAEPGAEGQRLTGYQLATRLALWLWDGLPDDALLTAAGNGGLDTAEGVRSQARRMLADPRAHDAVVRFHAQWLSFDDVPAIRPDASVYGGDDFDGTELDAYSVKLQQIKLGMQTEAELFVDYVIFDSTGTLSELLTSREGFTSDFTSDIHGVGPDASTGKRDVPFTGYFADDGGDVSTTFSHVVMPAGQRAGVLTLPGVLAPQAHAVHPAPVLRGKLILERLLCETIDGPPPSAAAAAPPQAPDPTSTNRERQEAAVKAPSCSVCHTRMNPFGYAYENYDSLGAWRDLDDGQPIDASATASTEADEAFAFDGAVALADALANSAQVSDCYVTEWTRYALGRTPDAEESAALAALQATFRDNGGEVLELLVDIAASDLLATRRGGF